MPDSSAFPGFAPFIDAACEGRPDVKSLAMRQTALSGGASLLAQLRDAAPEVRPEILAHAERHFDALRACVVAADAMLAEVKKMYQFGAEVPPDELTKPAPKPAPPAKPEPPKPTETPSDADLFRCDVRE